MSLSMYQAFVPAYTQMLKSLSAVLKKAEAHCEAKKIDPSVFVNARLYPDMAPLSKQIQIATDQVKGGLSRLAGKEPPSWPDTETTFADLHKRLQTALDFAASFKPEQRLDTWKVTCISPLSDLECVPFITARMYAGNPLSKRL